MRMCEVLYCTRCRQAYLPTSEAVEKQRGVTSSRFVTAVEMDVRRVLARGNKLPFVACWQHRRILRMGARCWGLGEKPGVSFVPLPFWVRASAKLAALLG
jgi:hypothetical protein